MGVLDAEILTDGARDGSQEGWDGPSKVHLYRGLKKMLTV